MPPRSKKVKNENSAIKVAEFGNGMKEGIVNERDKIDENINDKVDKEAKEITKPHAEHSLHKNAASERGVLLMPAANSGKYKLPPGTLTVSTEGPQMLSHTFDGASVRTLACRVAQRT